MPLQQTSGAASYDAFGGGAPVAAKYIEDFFQTWLRTGTGSSTTVTTGLNGAINETMVWTKSRSAATNHKLTDNVRGATKALSSNTTGAEVTDSQGLTAFSSTGYTIGTNTDYNNSGATYVDWQFVATPKFFDVVTYTGNGSSQNIAHNLGSVPGCIIVKSTSTVNDWRVYHRSLATVDSALRLNSTAAVGSSSTFWNSTAPTSTQFTVGSDGSVNANGATYVAYLFAHNAGGFGLSGTDNVISCGSFTTDGSGNATVNLGYEPQWVLYKPSTAINNWKIFDNMRGMVVGNGDQALYPNTSGAEVQDDSIQPAATGFSIVGGDASATHIYIAIRRGPMRTPTTGTSVFDDIAATNTTGTPRTIGFPSDFVLAKARDQVSGFAIQDRLRGALTPNAPGTTVPTLVTSTAAAETSSTGIVYDVNNTQAYDGTYLGANPSIFYHLRRAPGFFDEVCYTGTGTTGQTYAHNLGVAPEMMIVKSRTVGSAWYVYTPTTGNTNTLVLNSTAAVAVRNVWGDTTPTASVFSVGTSGAGTNNSGATYVAYLFASCPGVSKVFNYTGNGSSQTINCGFTGGARFVMIKRTDSTGDWYVWDTARGIVANNDPHLSLNTTAAEVTTNDTIDTDSTGFVVNQISATNVNVNGASYIGLAIA